MTSVERVQFGVFLFVSIKNNSAWKNKEIY